MRVGRCKGKRFGRSIPVFIRNGDFRHVVFVDFDLEVFSAGDGPFDFRHVVIDIADQVGKIDGFELLLLVDGLVWSFLDDGRIVYRANGKVRRGFCRSVFGIGRDKGNLVGTVPMGVRNDDVGDAIFGDIDGQFALRLVFGGLRHLVFPGNLVFRMVGVFYIIVKLDGSEGLAFVDGLIGDFGNFRRVIDGFHRERHGFGT